MMIITMDFHVNQEHQEQNGLPIVFYDTSKNSDFWPTQFDSELLLYLQRSAVIRPQSVLLINLEIKIKAPSTMTVFLGNYGPTVDNYPIKIPFGVVANISTDFLKTLVANLSNTTVFLPMGTPIALLKFKPRAVDHNA